MCLLVTAAVLQSSSTRLTRSVIIPALPTMSRQACRVVTVLLLTAQCLCLDSQATETAKPNPQSESTHLTSAPTNIQNASGTTLDLDIKATLLSNTNESSNVNGTLKAEGGVFQHFGLETGAVKRTFYVVAGLTGVVLLYFTIKGISTVRRRRRKPRRYGLLAEKEMNRFRDQDSGSDDGDEDSTLFDARKMKSGPPRIS